MPFYGQNIHLGSCVGTVCIKKVAVLSKYTPLKQYRVLEKWLSDGTTMLVNMPGLPMCHVDPYMQMLPSISLGLERWAARGWASQSLSHIYWAAV